MANFIGNDDYRGYLNYVAQSGGNSAGQAKQLLGFVGNDAKFGAGAGVINPQLVQYNNDFYKNFQGSHQAPQPYQAPNLMGGGANYAVPAPNWDLTSIYNQAGGAAAASVNPYYTSQLQQFQQNQAQAKAIQDQQRQLTLENQQKQLDTQLQGNETSRGRTSQDTLLAEQQVGQQADIRQQDQGTQFEQARIAQAKQLGELTGSGLGQQQATQSAATYNTQEQRQGAQDHQQVAAQELSKARTFEDLANSDVLSKTTQAQGQKQSQIDWDKFVQGQASDLQQTQQQLEGERLSRLSTVQKQLAQTQVNNMIHALSNPAQRQAAAAAYGGRFA